MISKLTQKCTFFKNSLLKILAQLLCCQNLGECLVLISVPNAADILLSSSTQNPKQITWYSSTIWKYRNLYKLVYVHPIYKNETNDLQNKIYDNLCKKRQLMFPIEIIVIYFSNLQIVDRMTKKWVNRSNRSDVHRSDCRYVDRMPIDSFVKHSQNPWLSFSRDLFRF